MVTTPIYNIPLPEPGGDEDAWAPILNDAVVALEAELKAVSDLVGGGGITQDEADARFVNLSGDTMTGDLNIANADPVLTLSKAASGNLARINGMVGNLARWSIDLGGALAESGANAGSNFNIWRYNDAGAAIDQPLSIMRATGQWRFGSSVGTAAVPNLTFATDENTGLARVAADTMILSTGGVERLRIANAALTSALPLTLPGPPTQPLHAVTKQHLDDELAKGALRGVGYLWGPTTQVAPLAGHINVFSINATEREMRISKTDADGYSRSAAFFLIGDTLTLSTSPTAFARYVVTAQPQEQADHWVVFATRTDTTGSQTPPPAETRVTLTGVLSGGTGIGITQDQADARYVNLTGDAMTGDLRIAKSVPAVILDSPTAANRPLVGRTNGLDRWQMFLGAGTETGANNGGGGFLLQSYTDAGAVLLTVLGANRTGEVSIGQGPLADVRLSIRTPGAAASESGAVLLNTNTGSDGDVDIRFQTAGGANRGRVRGRREAATNNGSLVLSSYIGNTEQVALTLQSDRRAVFGGDTLVVSTARTPGSATATGVTGSVCWDANYVYVCVAPNTWKRAALATW
jgi:hypothetical protein